MEEVGREVRGGMREGVREIEREDEEGRRRSTRLQVNILFEFQVRKGDDYLTLLSVSKSVMQPRRPVS